MNDFVNLKIIEKELTNLTYLHYYRLLSLLAKSRFKWSGLPNGIDEKWIEKYLFTEGKCMFYKDATCGFMIAKCNDGGQLNFYDEPTVLRPVATNYNGNSIPYENNKECVVIRNNDDEIPTITDIKMYAYRLADISRTIDINISAMKTPVLVTGTKKQMFSLKQVYKQWNGFEPVLFGDNELDSRVLNVLKTDAPIVFDKLQIEKHAIWNECMTYLGINNANMDKRERLVDDEVQANNEQIELCAEMPLKSRKLACKRINELFGTNIDVEFRQPETANLEELEGGEI